MTLTYFSRSYAAILNFCYYTINNQPFKIYFKVYMLMYQKIVDELLIYSSVIMIYSLVSQTAILNICYFIINPQLFNVFVKINMLINHQIMDGEMFISDHDIQFKVTGSHLEFTFFAVNSIELLYFNNDKCVSLRMPRRSLKIPCASFSITSPPWDAYCVTIALGTDQYTVRRHLRRHLRRHGITPYCLHYKWNILTCTTQLIRAYGSTA